MEMQVPLFHFRDLCGVVNWNRREYFLAVHRAWQIVRLMNRHWNLSSLLIILMIPCMRWWAIISTCFRKDTQCREAWETYEMMGGRKKRPAMRRSAKLQRRDISSVKWHCSFFLFFFLFSSMFHTVFSRRMSDFGGEEGERGGEERHFQCRPIAKR